MPTDTSTVTIHMGASLDGFIARADGGVDWMQTQDTHAPGITLSDAEIKAFLASIDCYVLGARTYEHAMELGWPYGDTPVMVLTHRPLQSDRPTVEFHAGDLADLVNENFRSRFNTIWVGGGAMLTREFIRLGLADEISMMVLPVLLGGGTPFFDDIGIELPLHLVQVNAYKTGLVELRYALNQTGPKT